MKASEAIIAWNGIEDFRHEGRPGSVGVGPLLFDGDSDWTRPYLFTGGAAEVRRRTLTEKEQQFAVLQDFYNLVHVYGLHPDLVHQALLHIDEYHDVMKSVGADPESGAGRTNYAATSIEENRVERSFHFAPAD